jgi:very-short-patch-repair endonuclease
MDAVEGALLECQGVARVGDLMASGVTQHSIRAGLASGRLLRPARGIVALPEADPVLVRCASTNSLLTCVSAAELLGLWVVHRPESVHLLRRDGRFSSKRAVVHRGSWAPPAPGSHVASRLDVVMHALHCLPELEALVVAESAVKQGLPLELLRAQLTGPRNGPARSLLDRIHRGADSLLETLAREHIKAAGLHVEAQVKVDGVGWMDIIVEKCLDLETDGKTHQEPASRYQDYARDGRAQSLGFATLRVGYADVVHRPEHMVDQVRRIVARRLALGGLPTY